MGYSVNINLAIELKENGFPSDNIMWWWNKDGYLKSRFTNNIYTKKCIPVLNSDEILKELPNQIYNKYGDVYYVLRIICTTDYYDVSYGFETYDGWIIPYELPMKSFQDYKLSDSLAKMWIYLKKEGYIK